MNEQTIFHLIFDAARGEVDEQSREVVSGSPVGKLPVPVRRGYRFAGWYCGTTEILPDTVPEGEEDLILTARWEKKERSRGVVSSYRRQRRAVLILCVSVVVLIGLLLIAKNIVSFADPILDTVYAEDGTPVTVKYPIQKKDGVYAAYRKDGSPMDQNTDGYYIADSGNQYTVDSKTGAWELYAPVEYDSAVGESLGFGNRVLIFPQIEQKNLYSLEIKNQNGSFRIYRAPAGTFVVEGSEDKQVMLDQMALSTLFTDCGYTLTKQRLALDYAGGGVDYSEYGLADVYDENGVLVYTPTTYTVTRSNYDATSKQYSASDVSYTVKVGDAILSGAGYYVQLEGRNTVYILGMDDLIKGSVESLVTPAITSPVAVAMYSMVNDFTLGTVEIENGFDNFQNENIIVRFSYEDMESRENTLYTSSPFVSHLEMMKGYQINDDTASDVLGKLYEMKFIACRKLGITSEAMHEYGLDGKVYFISYNSPVSQDNQIEGYVANALLISPKTPQGTYYVASSVTGMIVEVEQFYFSFLEYDQNKWYERSFLMDDLSYMKDLHLQVGDRSYDFHMDNSLSYAYYYNEEKSAYQQVNLSNGTLFTDSSERMFYEDQTGKRHEIIIPDFDRGTFRSEKGKMIFTDELGRQFTVSPGSSNIKVRCDQFTGGTERPDQLDYQFSYTYVDDAGNERSKTVTGISNFRQFYKKLISFSMEGDVDPDEFQANMKMSVNEFLQTGAEEPFAVIRTETEDLAKYLNLFTYEDELTKETLRLYTENNARDMIFRFYRYTGRKALMTVEVVKEYDADGNPITDPTRLAGKFYVLSGYLQELADTVDKLLACERIA